MKFTIEADTEEDFLRYFKGPDYHGALYDFYYNILRPVVKHGTEDDKLNAVYEDINEKFWNILAEREVDI